MHNDEWLKVVCKGWEDYELLDTGHGERLERFGSHTVVRPDPNVLWDASEPEHPSWQDPDARYVGTAEKSGWQVRDQRLLEGWVIGYGQAKMRVKPTPFRHMGLFPEQAAHWDWLSQTLQGAGGQPKVLNLFAYTGAASVVAALAGAEVCHLDASKGSVYQAKENAKLSGLPETAIRWIVDDALKFMQREVRRGNTYDLIMMDPPVFGRGPKGEIWRLEKGIADLAVAASQLFSEKPLGFLLNFYATSMYPDSIARVVRQALRKPFPELRLGSLLIAEKIAEKQLPTGFFVRS